MAAHAATTLGMLVAMFWVVALTRVGVPAPDVSLPDRRCPVKTANPPVGGTDACIGHAAARGPLFGVQGPCVGDWSTGRGRAAGSAR